MINSVDALDRYYSCAQFLCNTKNKDQELAWIAIFVIVLAFYNFLTCFYLAGIDTALAIQVGSCRLYIIIN